MYSYWPVLSVVSTATSIESWFARAVAVSWARPQLALQFPECRYHVYTRLVLPHTRFDPEQP
jgi:hypothetical protein